MFDGQTADYAITAGNDRKIRYCDLLNPENKSYQLNSPLDEEVQYQAENLTKDTKLILEKPVEFNKFPRMNAYRVNDKSSAIP